LFTDGDGAEAPTPGAAVTVEPTSGSAAGEQDSASGSGGERCFGRYFKGIPSDRVGTVESGSKSYDVITPSQTKTGWIGMTFTRNARPIGAIRFALFPENRIFKIESIVDVRCRVIEDYQSTTEGDKHVWQDSATVKLRLAGRVYNLTANGAGNGIRIQFVDGVP
jgi:hypothetical protein